MPPTIAIFLNLLLYKLIKTIACCSYQPRLQRIAAYEAGLTRVPAIAFLEPVPNTTKVNNTDRILHTVPYTGCTFLLLFVGYCMFRIQKIIASVHAMHAMAFQDNLDLSEYLGSTYASNNENITIRGVTLPAMSTIGMATSTTASGAAGPCTAKQGWLRVVYSFPPCTAGMYVG
jgi:hypothetical protein